MGRGKQVTFCYFDKYFDFLIVKTHAEYIFGLFSKQHCSSQLSCSLALVNKSFTMSPTQMMQLSTLAKTLLVDINIVKTLLVDINI